MQFIFLIASSMSVSNFGIFALEINFVSKSVYIDPWFGNCIERTTIFIAWKQDTLEDASQQIQVRAYVQSMKRFHQ